MSSPSHVITITEEIPDPNNNSSSDGEKAHNLLPWKIVCVALALAVALGWVGVIVLLILKDEWQLVLIAWLLLYAGGHFCYWYLRRHARDQSASFRERMWARLQAAPNHTPAAPVPAPHASDLPPSYSDILKSELPPPAYYSVCKGTPRMQRVVRNLPLPWFLKKKALENQHSTSSSSSDDVVRVEPTKYINEGDLSPRPASNVCTVTLSPDQSASVEYDYQSDEMWKSSGGGGPRSDSVVVANISLTNLGGADSLTIQLPSYEDLMRAEPGDQPVLTPIHRALAGLPSTEQRTNEQA